MSVISIQSKTAINSAVVPGIRFTVRTLNRFARAERDFAIAEQTFEYGRLIREINDLLPAGYFDAQKAAAAVAALEADEARGDDVKDQLAAARKQFEALQKVVATEDTTEKARERQMLDYRAMLIAEQHIKPATIRAALLDVLTVDEEGNASPLLIDGEPATADLLIKSAGSEYDLLLEEIFLACDNSAGLNSSVKKKSESAITSSGQEPTGLTISSAEAAGS